MQSSPERMIDVLNHIHCCEMTEVLSADNVLRITHTPERNANIRRRCIGLSKMARSFKGAHFIGSELLCD
jgi:hypothetical protein